MKRINNFPLYELGAAMRPLQDFTPQTNKRSVAWPIMQAQFVLRMFLDDKSIPLNFSTQTAQELYNLLHSTVPIDERNIEITPEQELALQGFLIADKAKTFEHELAAELRQLDTYFVAPQGIFSTAKLMQRADEMFTPSIRQHLSDRVKSDIREAGKCIACELGTAAGFHIARAVESELLDYLKKLCPDVLNKLPAGQRNLGGYIKLARENKAEAKLCASLDQFRDLHRNPLMHPDEDLTVDEAISLIGIAQSSIISMALEINEQEKQPLLPLTLPDESN